MQRELGNKKCDVHIYSLCHTLVLPLLGTLRPREGKGLDRVTQGLPPESVFWPRAPPGYRCPGAHHLWLSGRVLWCCGALPAGWHWCWVPSELCGEGLQGPAGRRVRLPVSSADNPGSSRWPETEREQSSKFSVEGRASRGRRTAVPDPSLCCSPMVAAAASWSRRSSGLDAIKHSPSFLLCH